MVSPSRFMGRGWILTGTGMDESWWNPAEVSATSGPEMVPDGVLSQSRDFGFDFSLR